MADVLGKKISELAETTDLAGLYTIGSDRNNQSKKVPLQFVKEAADYANAQGDYAKGVGDTVQGNTGVDEYPVFSASTQYAAGSVVRYNDKLYRFTALHPAGSWVGTDAVETSIKAEADLKLTELESIVGAWEHGFIMQQSEGVVRENPNYSTSKLSFLRKGVCVMVYTDSTPGVAIINEYDNNGNFIRNVLSAGGQASVGDIAIYKYIVEQDSYFRVCYRSASNNASAFWYNPENIKNAAISITGFGANGTSGGVTKNGEVYYNYNTKKLRKSLDVANGIYETIEFSDVLVVFFEGIYWYWNGTDLVPENSWYKTIFLKGIGTDGIASGADGKGDIYLNTNTKKFRKNSGFRIGDVFQYEDVYVDKSTLIIYKNKLYTWDGLQLIGLYEDKYEPIDLSKLGNFHTQYIYREDGTFNNRWEGTTIDSYLISVKEGDVFHVKANAGANQAVVVGMYDNTFSDDAVPLLVKLTHETTGVFVYDDDVTIPEGINWILVMSRNETNASYNSDYPLTVSRKVFVTKSYLSTDYNIKHFSVKINIHPMGVFGDANGDYPTTIEDGVNYRTVTGGVILPKNYNENGLPCRAIMVMMGGHGYMNRESWYPSSPDFYNIVVPYFLERGYAVFGCNGFTDCSQYYAESLGLTNNLGLPDTIEAYWKSYEHVVNNYNIHPLVHLWGGSQGGIAVMNFTAYHPNVVASVACMAPLLNLETTGWNETGGRSRISDILGFAGTSIYENDKADMWNPMKRIVTINNTDYYFGFPVPIKMCYGTQDEVLGGDRMIPFKKMSRALINGAARCYCKWYDGYNHMDVAFGFKEVVRKDICDFFDRF